LPLFKTALEANPKKEQFWLSYIDALIKAQQFKNAKQVIERAKKKGVAQEKLHDLELQLKPVALTSEHKATLPKISIKSAENREKRTKAKKKGKHLNNNVNPTDTDLDNLLMLYQNKRFDAAGQLAASVSEKFPKHPFSWKVLGAALQQTGRIFEAVKQPIPKQ